MWSAQDNLNLVYLLILKNEIHLGEDKQHLETRPDIETLSYSYV